MLEETGIECRFKGTAVLDGADISLAPGELVALLGPSGSGKTTLLNVLCGFARPDRGSVRFLGEEVDPARLDWRSMAVLPQALGLLAELTAEENIALPARLARRPAARDGLLRELDIDLLAARHPAQLSLGEGQRVGVARTLALEPRVVLADEPTSHQDARRTGLVLDLFRRRCDAGTACLLATHDEQAIAAADRVLGLSQGRVVAL